MKVVIARLYFNKMLMQFEDSFRRNIDMLLASGLVENASVSTTAGLAVDMARNNVVSKNLDDFDAVIWLDTDMIYPDDAMCRLVAMHQAGYPIAAGVYRRAFKDRDLLTEIEEGCPATIEELDALALEACPVKVEQTAGGFSIVSMDLYRAIAAKIGHPWYCNFDFRYLHDQCGEDRFFVRLASHLGVYPHVDPDLTAVHWPPQSSPVPVRADDPLLKWTV